MESKIMSFPSLGVFIEKSNNMQKIDTLSAKIYPFATEVLDKNNPPKSQSSNMVAILMFGIANFWLDLDVMQRKLLLQNRAPKEINDMFESLISKFGLTQEQGYVFLSLLKEYVLI